tara:strand:- start:51973 stop:52314 length:342 start_codon:yes stop_codon:yes gene_type:complete
MRFNPFAIRTKLPGYGCYDLIPRVFCGDKASFMPFTQLSVVGCEPDDGDGRSNVAGVVHRISERRGMIAMFNIQSALTQGHGEQVCLGREIFARAGNLAPGAGKLAKICVRNS